MTLARPEVTARPSGRERGIHETGQRDQGKTRSDNKPGVNIFQQVDRQQSAYGLRQRDFEQHRPGL